MDRHLEHAFPDLAFQMPGGEAAIIAICWPYRNEYDARHVAVKLRKAGATIALPVVVAPGEALEFREWHPGVRMARGPMGIPYPARTEEVDPTVVILPVVGFDDAGFRLGYGGGYFDRTLAAMDRRALVIGAAHEFARLPTIYPQLHDIPVDYVITESGLYQRNADLRGTRLEFLGVPPAPALPGFRPVPPPAARKPAEED